MEVYCVYDVVLQHLKACMKLCRISLTFSFLLPFQADIRSYILASWVMWFQVAFGISKPLKFLIFGLLKSLKGNYYNLPLNLGLVKGAVS